MNNQRQVVPYIVGFIITALLILVAYMALFVPKLEARADLEKQTEATEVVNNGLAAQVAQVEENKKNTAKLTKEIADFNKSFPVGASQQTMLADIAWAAQESGAKLTGLNPEIPVVAVTDVVEEAPVDTAGTSEDVDAALAPAKATAAEAMGVASDVLASVNLTLNASGPRAALESFVKRLEDMPRPVKIGTLSIEGEGDTASMGATATMYFVAPLVDPIKAAEVKAAEEAKKAEEKVVAEAKAPAEKK